jgi:hypothetical protein
MTLLRPTDIDFASAKAVVSAAQKFIVPVAAFVDADPLVYPPDTEKAGRPIVDGNGNRVGESGIIFFNSVDRCLQAAAADGRSVIIVNDVSGEQARAIESVISRLGEPIDNLSKAALEELIWVVTTEIGLVDVYNSTDDHVRSRMVPILGLGAVDGSRPSGWMRRNDKGVCNAVFVRGPGQFAGPAATPQQIPAQGAFVIRQGEEFRMVDTGVMLSTYVHVDGRPLELVEFL